MAASFHSTTLPTPSALRERILQGTVVEKIKEEIVRETLASEKAEKVTIYMKRDRPEEFVVAALQQWANDHEWFLIWNLGPKETYGTTIVLTPL